MRKFLSLLLALTMLFSLVACGDDTTPVEDNNDDNNVVANNGEETPAGADADTDADTDADADNNEASADYLDFTALAEMDKEEADEIVYDYVLGEYAAAYADAKEETGDLRMAKMALAEAKLLESGAFLPVQTSGGAFTMSRVVPRTNAATTLWGLDEYRYHTLLVTNELISAADRTECIALWSAAESAEDYRTKVKEFLTGKGYTFTDTYTSSNGYAINIWDTIATSYTSDSMFVAGTYDNLLEYDAKGVQQPGLAESYEVSDDGLTYTFHIRKGVKWVDQQGSEIGEVTADDWVASMEHLLDNFDALGYLMSADGGCGLVGFDDYLAGTATFEDVGVKAIDDYTLQYTLINPFPPFPTMLGYACFAPLNRDFYKAQGGTFGAEGDTYTPGDYGKTPANIAYCGPYLITNYTERNITSYSANPTYWNPDSINIKTLVYTYNDGSDVTRAYEEAKAGTIAGAGIAGPNLESAKVDKLDGDTETIFEKYAYVSDGAGTTYCGWMNVNRGTWANWDDPTVGVSPKNEEEQLRTKQAMALKEFRLAFLTAFDRGAYNACSVGEELKYNRLRNSYVPGTFQFLASDVTVDVNGTSTTFPAGTSFGKIEQAQLDADGVDITVWNDETASGDGFDGWYNPDFAKAQLEIAIQKLAEQGVEVSADKPIYVDYPYETDAEIAVNQANSLKQSVEAALEGKVIVNLVAMADSAEMESATYRFSTGAEANFDLSTGSGWGPDYGDAQTYLDTIQAYGYMAKNIGLF